MANGFTNLSVREETKKRLTARGRYGDSLDSIINRVLDEADELRDVKERLAKYEAQGIEGATA